MAAPSHGTLASDFWLSAWAATLSWCWLLPNHYLPWSSFHMDVWAAAAILPMAMAVIWKSRGESSISWFAALALGLALLPWLQYAGGMIAFAGEAWMASSYLLAFALAIMVGQSWERFTPAQVGDGIFLAVGIASLLSVGLQLHQWLQLDMLGIWSMGNGLGRPYANFGQPNQLGTLLLWGILAMVWAALRGRISSVVLVGSIVFLLFGLALTASRTAWVGLAILCIAAWYFSPLFRWRHVRWVAGGLGMCFVVFVLVMPLMTKALLLADATAEADLSARVLSELRPRIWAMLLDAVWRKPWSGYGWGQVGTAQLETALAHPPLGILTNHSHNLFLDLFVYGGIPVGLAASGFLLAWLWTRLRALSDPEAVTMLLLVLVIGNHAMLEFPLHYAYFLLPVGLVIGALNARLGFGPVLSRGGILPTLLALVLTGILGLIVRDYLRTEASVEILRFERANIAVNVPREAPEVVLLDHLRAAVLLARFEPTGTMSPENLDWMRRTVSLYPTAGSVQKLAAALVWNGYPSEAVDRFRRLCTVMPPSHCDAVRNGLNDQAKHDPRIAAVFWP